MSTPSGQTILVDYQDSVNSGYVNLRVAHNTPRGIYSGGYLTKVSDTSVSLSALTCEIGDNTYQIKAVTATTNTITISTSAPYVVLRWAYAGSINTAMTFAAVSAPSTNELVVGKCVFSGSTLNSFDYSLRSSPVTLSKYLLVEPTEVASMYVRVRAGKISFGSTTVDIVDQISPVFTAPVSNSRIDVVACDSTGVISIIQGVSGSSPVAPDYANKLALAEVTLTSSSTSITSSMIRNVANAAKGVLSAVLLSGDQTVAGVKTFSSFPITPSSAPTTDYQMVNKKYVDDASGLGSWATKVVGTTYQAATDGFITAWVDATDAAWGYLQGYTDSSATPTTRRVVDAFSYSTGNEVIGNASVTFPVKKGDYYKVVLAVSYAYGGTAATYMYFLPLGD